MPAPRHPAPSHTSAPALDTFLRLRPRLMAIAYRMLGSRADAEDVLQDAWLRWERSDTATLQSADAWLVTIVTRLSIDRLRAAKTEREAYVGWWLPEPLVALDEHTPETAAEMADELSVALLRVLERLAPEERAAFLFRQVFDYDYADIAGLLDKSEAACRQMVHRAVDRVQQERPRFTVSKDSHRQVVERFMLAARSGERAAMKALIAEDVVLMSDGGGKVSSFTKALHGADRVTNLYWATALRLAERVAYRPALVNGEAGLLRYMEGRLESAQTFETDGERIVAIYVVRNPDKLASVPAHLLH